VSLRLLGTGVLGLGTCGRAVPRRGVGTGVLLTRSVHGPFEFS
jgi:hypothetical protein